MESTDTHDEAEFRMQARKFLESASPAKGSAADFVAAYQSGQITEADYFAAAKAWQRTLAEAGWACIAWPKEFGGRGGSFIEATIFAEEQEQRGVSNSCLGVGLSMVGPTIIAYGTPEEVASNPKSVTGKYLQPLLGAA